MNENEIIENLKKIITEKIEIDASKITMQARFREDLEADSLDTYELIHEIEEEFNIEIPDEEANEFETVGDAYEFIKNAITK